MARKSSYCSALICHKMWFDPHPSHNNRQTQCWQHTNNSNFSCLHWTHHRTFAMPEEKATEPIDYLRQRKLIGGSSLHIWSPNNEMGLEGWFKASLIGKRHSNIFRLLFIRSITWCEPCLAKRRHAIKNSWKGIQSNRKVFRYPTVDS